MNEPSAAPARPGRFGGVEVFAALDLGTNNCRLLVATPSGRRGFRIVDSYSRIVRLGEGLSQSGPPERSGHGEGDGARCASAPKGAASRRRSRARDGDPGLPHRRQRSGVPGRGRGPHRIAPGGSSARRRRPAWRSPGASNLIDPAAEAVLMLDVGGGSTELSWLDLRASGSEQQPGRSRWRRPPIAAWLSMPIGVVIAGRAVPPGEAGDVAGFRAMVDAVRAEPIASPAPRICAISSPTASVISSAPPERSPASPDCTWGWRATIAARSTACG